MFEWEHLFESHILDRGWSYARKGAVEYIKEKDGRIEAVVSGTEYYKVVLERTGSPVTSAYCSCPYAAKGYYCKHMAAVLYSLDAKDALTLNTGRGQDEDFQEYMEVEEQSPPVSIEQLISEADHEELEAVLLDLALEDDRLESRIRSMLLESRIRISPSGLRWEIDNIFNTYTYKGYIDYHNAFSFANDLIDCLKKISEQLLKQQSYLELFEVTIYAYTRLGNCDIDDDGEITEISHVCYEIWQNIISECPTEVRDSIKEWFDIHSSDGTVIDFMEDYLQDFQRYELASREQLKKELAQLDQMVEACKEKTQCSTIYTTFYGYNIEAVELRIILMRRLGASEEEVDQYRRKYMNFRSIRKYYLQKAQQEEDVEKEMQLLLMSKQLDKNEHYLMHAYAQRLIELYQRQNNPEREKVERRNDLLSYTMFSLDDFRNYRRLCSAEEWKRERIKLIEAQNDNGRKCQLLAEEQLYDELFRLIMQENQERQIDHLNQFGFLLAEDYSEEILSVYREYVSQLASYARNRTSYELLTRYLLRMQQYTGGKELVEKLCETWIAKYPTRKVMVSELRKLRKRFFILE